MSRWLDALCLGLWLAMVSSAFAESAHALDERRLIQRQRAEAEAQFAIGARECAQRFAVTACVDALRTRNRQTLADLRAREIELDEAERRAAAQAARQRREARQAAMRAPRSATDAPVRRFAMPASGVASGAPARHIDQGKAPPGESAEPKPARPAPPRFNRKVTRPERAADEAAAEAAAAERAAAQQKRTRQEQAHRERIEQRNARRAAEGKRAPPLPIPEAASAASP